MEPGIEEQMEKCELEEHFVLRLPEKEAKKVRDVLKKKPKKLKKMLNIDLNVGTKEASVQVNKKVLHGKVLDLPTIVESHKTVDKVNVYKTANISQILVCSKQQPLSEAAKPEEPMNAKMKEKNDKKKLQHAHGLTPPLKNARKYRFRKTLKNPNDIEEAEDVEKEVLLLLRTDNEAVSSRFEIIYENEPNNNVSKVNEISEKSIFGENLSETESDESIASGLNDLMDFTT